MESEILSKQTEIWKTWWCPSYMKQLAILSNYKHGIKSQELQ